MKVRMLTFLILLVIAFFGFSILIEAASIVITLVLGLAYAVIRFIKALLKE